MPVLELPPIVIPRHTDRRIFDRAKVVDENFIEFLEAFPRQAVPGSRRPADQPLRDDSSLTGRDVLEIMESQFLTRHQDLEARLMRARNEGFYTIGSGGHEGNAVVGRLTRQNDMAFLHYRAGAFMAERARKVPAIDFVRDTMLSFAASADDPISGGRHKVWGSVPLWVPPQTSTIASHLPKAVGAAVAIRRAVRRGKIRGLDVDSIIVCSFGDASVNHATAQTAFNAAGWSAYRGLPVPVLFVCEDNGVGISVPTPRGWVERSMSHRPGLEYIQANSLDLFDSWEKTEWAVDRVRRSRIPTFLHLRTVRLMGHAGTDVETGYRSWEDVEATETNDPLLHTARLAICEGLMTPEEVLDHYEHCRGRVQQAARDAARTPKLTDAAVIVAPLAPFTADAVAAEARRAPAHGERLRAFGGEEKLPENLKPAHMAVLVNRGLHDLMAKYDEALLFGEDVARKGGVYNVTGGLQKSFGEGRVWDSLLDETMILGMAGGAAHLGMLPMPEIQYLAYYHNAQDQVRGEACSLQFFSNAQYACPMMIRVQGWGYQKGFGGHFHNDNSIAALRDVPALTVVTSSRGDDTVKLMRTLMAMGRVNGRVSIIIDPIALYMTKDLYEPKDGLWQFDYPKHDEAIDYLEGKVYHEDAADLTIFTFANGVHMSLRAAKELKEKRGIAARVVDLRWLQPLNEDLIEREANATGRVLVVDEGRRAGGVAESVLAVIAERCPKVRARRLNAMDTYIPLGGAANLVMPTEEDVLREAERAARG